VRDDRYSDGRAVRNLRYTDADDGGREIPLPRSVKALKPPVISVVLAVGAKMNEYEMNDVDERPRYK